MGWWTKKCKSYKKNHFQVNIVSCHCFSIFIFQFFSYSCFNFLFTFVVILVFVFFVHIHQICLHGSRFSSNASMHTPTNILDYAHAHLNEGGLYLDLPKGVILHLELEVLYWTCQALALQLEEGTQVDLPIEEFHDSK